MNMALGKNLSTGRADAAQDSVMKKIRKPRFVDNAVRHGQYNKGTAGFKVEAPVQSDFIPATERKYRLFEEEDTIRLVHNTTDGHRYEGAIFLDEDKVTASSTLPALIVGADNPQQSLVPSKIETATKGTRYGLENLKGRSLKEIGFTDKTIRFAQKVGVGLRTSDLATRVANSSKSSINGIKVSVPSTTFVAKDFYGVDSISALRYLAKHDYYSPRSDRFGNLLYVPQTQIEREHFLNENRVSGGSSENNNDAVPNRIVVRGKSRANNDDNVVQIDDFGTQKDTVNEVPGGIHAPTALTKASARRIGQNMLRMAKKASGSMTLNDVLSGTHIQPGDSVNYQSRSNSDRKIVLGGSYDLINRKSQLQVNSVDATLEDVLQRFQEVDISGSLDENYERNRQFSVEEFTTSFGVKMKISWEIAERVDSNRGVGFNLGQPNRDTIHGARRLQSTGVLINNGAGHAIGTYLFTVDGNNAASTFSNNQAIYTKNGNKLGHVMEIASFTVGSGAYNNDPTITHASSTSIKLGMAVSGTGIPAGAYVASITSNTEFELSASTTGGSKTGQTLTFTTTTATILAISSRSVHPVSDNDEIYTLPETLPETRNSHLKVGLVQTKYLRNRRG
tara:strand:- start:9994 stop:11856 length:1863 start_codon:yes stop_codon:yes gene_type:complete